MSSHCHDEHSSNGHDGHNHDGHHHDEHHHSDEIAPAAQSYLYGEIEFDKITTLNEAQTGSGRAIVEKTWQHRMDALPELQSDVDEQILMHIPFAGQVKLHALLFRTSSASSAPQTVHIFVNRDMDFALAAELRPTQSLELAQTSDIQEIPLKRALFNSIRSVSLFYENNWSAGDDAVTRLSFLGFKGDHLRLIREPVSVLYESAAQPSDHKSIVGIGSPMDSGIGSSRGHRSGM